MKCAAFGPVGGSPLLLFLIAVSVVAPVWAQSATAMPQQAVRYHFGDDRGRWADPNFDDSARGMSGLFR
jgi:hypothetical protein